MSYISLYRKYRPTKFSDVVGQDVIIKIIKNSIINNKIGHAYIFSGPRGTGKTTVAKIFAKAVNCLNFVDDVCEKCENCTKKSSDEIDIIEMDAASNNGVDEIREIINNVKYMPSNLKYKVYIIDEVHMLSTSAFNALLKTLEEPPNYVIFILATTEFNKIPITVVSRCQKFDFKKIDEKSISNRLKYILKNEQKKLNDDVIDLIAKISDGGLRDSINLMDQILSLNNINITVDQVYNLLGELNDNEISELLMNIVNFDIKEILNKINIYSQEGKNFNNIVNKLELLLRNILIFNTTNNYFEKKYEKELLKFNKIDVNDLLSLCIIIFELSYEMKRTNNSKTLLEIYFLKMALLFNKKTQTNVLFDSTNNNIREKKLNKSIKNNSDDYICEIEEIKKININNALYSANKELKKEFINKYKNINEYLSNKEYNAICNLLIKAIPEVVGETNILFTFKNNFEVLLFNKNIDNIEKFLKMLYNKKYTVIAVSEEEWISIKKKYIENIKAGIKYEYMKEKKTKNINTKNTELQSSVENIFGSDYTTI